MNLCTIFVRSSDPTGLIVWCVIGIGAGIGLFIYGFRLLQRRRLILDTPFSKIRSASMGLVEISGLAVGPYTMIAPVTGKPCYYYRTLVWEWKQRGKSKEWVRIAGESMHVPFFLDDNTGRVLVDPRGADLDVHRDFQEEFCDGFFTTKDPAPDKVNSFLARHGVSTSNKIKVEEYCIKPKNALFIMGTLSENPGIEVKPEAIADPDAGTGSGLTLAWSGFGVDSGSLLEKLAPSTTAIPQEVIVLSDASGPSTPGPVTQQQKIAAALRKAGISNPAAWSAAGLGSPKMQVTTSTATDECFDSHPAVVLMKGTNNKTFLISWRSQQDVARSLGWKCMLMIWGGPVLALVSLYVLLQIA